MICCHYDVAAAGCDDAFTVDASRITFGRGCLAEVGERARALELRRVALFTDARVALLPHAKRVRASLLAAGVDVVSYEACAIEPTNESFEEAIRFASSVRPDGYVSLGGGSVIDTCKAANLYHAHPAPLATYVNAPLGDGRPVPGPLAPHIACPTTSGTGSEVTGIAVFDDLRLRVKTAIASPALRPTEALVDPDVTATLPGEVVAASGLDVLCHALESYTARPFTRRPASAAPSPRPMSQGANPWSDIGCREALALTGRYLARATRDASDAEAREAMMWAATLAGIAFGNAGVHIPHAMAYAVAGLASETTFVAPGYPQQHGSLVPHGISVVVNAPAVLRFTAATNPVRHLDAASWLGAETRDAAPGDAAEVLAGRLVALMRELGMPNGIGGVGYRERHVDALVAGTLPQARLLSNAPREATGEVLAELFRGALAYW